MTAPTDNKSSLKPILEEDVTRTAQFLQQHMVGTFSAEQWERGLRASWYRNSPHHGFMIESGGEVVGVICTLYSEQEIDGETRLICNPHTWCVLEPYRAKSVSLILSVIRQPGLHFSMYSPNRDGEEIFAYLGFKPLDRQSWILLNVPTLQLTGTIGVSFDIEESLAGLSDADRRCVEDHRGFEWLRFLFYRRGERTGFAIYKHCRYKRLPCAHLLHVSDDALFKECWSVIRSRLLLKQGIVTTKTEQRLLNDKPSFSFSTSPASAKFYLSDSLSPEAFNYTYSELVALDI